jgi:RES domain-containing protein
MRFRGTCYRAHDPRWSFTPLAGNGAAVHGGRFNPKGTPALYLSLSLQTAIKEINQGFAHKIDPCVLCSYDVDCADVADLRDDKNRAKHGVKLADMACAWFALAASGRDPPSWQIARRLTDQGIAGIVVPSFVRGALGEDQNLVLWNWGKSFPHKLAVYDPSGKLPKNQLSWD